MATKLSNHSDVHVYTLWMFLLYFAVRDRIILQAFLTDHTQQQQSEPVHTTYMHQKILSETDDAITLNGYSVHVMHEPGPKASALHHEEHYCIIECTTLKHAVPEKRDISLLLFGQSNF